VDGDECDYESYAGRDKNLFARWVACRSSAEISPMCVTDLSINCVRAGFAI
jgi:hypothetical protein